MNKYVLDVHMHTLACDHAYNTLLELAEEAERKKLEMICLTEHGPALVGAPTAHFFANYRIIPSVINNVKVLKGIESNILDTDGTVDIPQAFTSSIEIRSAALHPPTFAPKTKNENTSAVLGAINNDQVDFICHLGNPVFDLDYEAVLQEAKKQNTMIEINNSSFFIRKGSKPNCLWIAKRCKELEIPIVVGSDAHFATDVGNFTYVQALLEEANFPDELIINLETKRLTDYLENKGRLLFNDIRDYADDLFTQSEKI